jgi:hypothetical protein
VLYSAVDYMRQNGPLKDIDAQASGTVTLGKRKATDDDDGDQEQHSNHHKRHANAATEPY